MDKATSAVWWGYVAGFAAVVFWSPNVIIAHWLANDLQPAQISLGRWGMAACLLTPYMVWDIYRTWAVFQQHLWRNVGLAVAIGTISIAIQNTLVYTAGRTASAIDMALIGSCGPIFLALLSAVLLHKPIGRKQGIGLAAAFCGVVLLILHGDITRLRSFNFVVGDLWMLLMALSFAIYTLVLSYRPAELKSATLLGMAVIVGVTLLSSYVGLTQGVQGFQLPDNRILLIFAYMGLFPSICSFLCWNSAISRLGAMRTSIIFYTMPLLSSVEAYFILGESMGLSQLWGAGLILGGVLFAARGSVTPPILHVHH